MRTILTVKENKRLWQLNRIKIPPVTEPVTAGDLCLLPGRRRSSARSMHRHTYYEVHYMFYGEAVYTLEDGTIFPLSTGEFLLIPPHVSHALEAESQEWDKPALYFSISDSESESIPFPTSVIKGGITPLMRDAFRLAARTVFFEDAVAVYLLRDACSVLLLQLASGSKLANRLPTSSIDVRFLRAKQFIKDNATRNLSVEEVASAVHLSSRQLRRLFAENGQSVSDYIEQIRCSVAKRTLAETNHPLAAIAEQLDFSNEYNFIRYFKRVEGIPPGQYRDRLAGHVATNEQQGG